MNAVYGRNKRRNGASNTCLLYSDSFVTTVFYVRSAKSTGTFSSSFRKLVGELLGKFRRSVSSSRLSRILIINSRDEFSKLLQRGAASNLRNICPLEPAASVSVSLRSSKVAPFRSFVRQLAFVRNSAVFFSGTELRKNCRVYARTIIQPWLLQTRVGRIRPTFL